MDDILGDDVSWGGLGTKNAHQRHSRGVTRANLEILMDEVEQVQLLALVLMQALGLDIEHGGGVNLHTLGVLQPVSQGLFVVGLDLGEFLQHIGILGIGQQFFQLGGILAETGANQGFNLFDQCGVTFQQPAAEGDAVGFVVELFRVQLIEAVQLGFLQNFGVQGGNAVGGMGKVDVHVGHVHAVVGVNDGKAGIIGALFGGSIQLFNHRHQLGHNFVQIAARPGFQRFGQDGVIGVSAGVGYDLDGFVKLDALFAQQADQFGDNHAGVGIVNLDGGVIGQVMVVAAAGGAFGQNQLGTGADHQVLLVDAQHAACFVGIVRVQEQGQVFGNGGFIELDAVMHNAFINGVQVKQVQGVGAALVAGHGQFVQPGSVRFACQGDGVGDIGLFRPGMFVQPGVRQFVLQAVGKALVEQAKVVTQADAVARQVQRCQRIQEAGSQTAQTAVAQARLRLDFLDVGKALACGSKGITHIIIQAEVDEVVGKQFADQKFSRDIIQLAAVDRAYLCGALAAHKIQQGKVNFLVGGFDKGLADQLL